MDQNKVKSKQILISGLILVLLVGGCTTGIGSTELAKEYYNIGLQYFNLGRYAEASEYYQKAIQLDDTLTKAYYNLTLSYIKEGRFSEAETILFQLLEEEPDNVTLLDSLAWLYYSDRRLNEALITNQKILDLFPEDITARYNKGIILWELGNREESTEEMKILLEFTPDNIQIKYILGKILLESAQPVESIKYLEEYLQEKPEDMEAYLLLAKGYQSLEQFDKALEAYSDVLSLNEKIAEAWFERGKILLTKVEDPEIGLLYLRQALDYGFTNKESISELLSMPDLLEKEKVRRLLEERNLLPRE